MAWIATAIVGGAVVGGGASLLGAKASSDAVKSASNDQKDTANATLAAQTKINTDTLTAQKNLYDEDVARNKPFYDTGVKANADLQGKTGFQYGGYDMSKDPAATFAMQQGSRTLNNQLANRGLLGGGNAAQRFGEMSSGIAAKGYGEDYTRKNNEYNSGYAALLDKVKIGTGASAATGQASQTLGSDLGQNSSSTIGALGQNSAAIQSAQGTAGGARAGLYSGAAGLPFQAANTGINAYRSGLFSPSAPSYTPDQISMANNPPAGGL